MHVALPLVDAFGCYLLLQMHTKNTEYIRIFYKLHRVSFFPSQTLEFE